MTLAVLGVPGTPGLAAFTQAHASGTVVGDARLHVAPAVRGGDAATSTATPDSAVPNGFDLFGGLTPGDDGMGTVTAADVPPLVLPPVAATATAAPVVVVPPSAPNGVGIPGVVLAAYKDAASSLAASDPGCHVPWTLIAGIGRVESGNAAGGRVDAAGTTRGRILGPRLDGGLDGTSVVRDTDGGKMDGDTAFDRAVGPMQFLPGTWRTYARDGNHDGVADPHNVFDAALATGAYLCAGGSDLSQPIPQQAALLRYNHSIPYGQLVMRWAAAYAAGVSVLPGEPGDVPNTAPTPPEQVPTPATGSSSALALSGSDGDGSDATSDSDTSSTSTTTTTTSTKTSTTKTSTTTSPTSTTSSSSTVTTTTAPPSSTSTVTTTPPPTPPDSTSTVTTTPPPSSATTTSTSTSTTSSRDTTSTTSGTPTSDTPSSAASKSDTTKSDTTKSDSTKSDATTASTAARSAAAAAVTTTPEPAPPATDKTSSTTTSSTTTSSTKTPTSKTSTTKTSTKTPTTKTPTTKSSTTSG